MVLKGTVYNLRRSVRYPWNRPQYTETTEPNSAQGDCLQPPTGHPISMKSPVVYRKYRTIFLNHILT